MNVVEELLINAIIAPSIPNEQKLIQHALAIFIIMMFRIMQCVHVKLNFFNFFKNAIILARHVMDLITIIAFYAQIVHQEYLHLINAIAL
jgi:hypothetical protein